MTNLTQARADQRQEGILVDVPLAASTKVFKGSNVNYNAAGFAKKASDTAGEVFAGVAMETKDSSLNDDNEKWVRVWKEGVFSMVCTGATQAWVGQLVHSLDDNVVALAAGATNDIVVGRVVQFVSATEVRVKI
jgi:predicted RecA/RadA family phage recombinase